MLANTPKLQLPQWEGIDDFDVAEVDAALLRVDTKLTPSSYTTALRPTGVERYDGLIILDTDLNKYIKWNASQGAWRSVDYNGDDTPSVVLTPGANITLSGSTSFTQKNAIAQISFQYSSSLAIGTGDIPNFTVATVPQAWWPRANCTLGQGLTGPLINYYFSTAGVITATATSDPVTAGFVLSVSGVYILT
jgi:hypothetical protein